jgi:alcohol dehydrogenase class IV
MKYWFEDQALQNLIPLATASAVKGIGNFFAAPLIAMGPNVFPDGIAIGPTILDFISNMCPKKRAFIVTDEFADRFVNRIRKPFEIAGFTLDVWNRVRPEVPMEDVKDCAAAMNAFEPDLIIAIGGGSVMDCAKVAWIVYERPDKADFALISPLEVLGLRKKALLAAIPTTSGTGSECTFAAVVHDTEAHRKIPLAQAELKPDFAILIPELTATMPPDLTVGTGLDVLAHAMDAVMSPTANEITDALCLASIKMVFKYLPRAFRNGKDREARYRMLLASSIAGMGFANSGAALTHSFGHVLGATFHIHHGLAVGFFIPFVFQFYKKVSDKYLEICDALKIPGKNDDERFDNLIRKLRDFFKELNVPLSIKEMGVAKDEYEKNIKEMASFAIEDIDTIFSPRPIIVAEYEKIFRYAYDGKDIDF